MEEILFTLGMNAKLYFGDTAAELIGMEEMSNVRDLTLTMESGEADITTRANQGWRATAPTLRECTVEFEMLWKPDDDGFNAVKKAFLSNGTVELAVLDQAKDAPGAQGPKGAFSITSFSRGEALEEGVTVNVTAKLAKFREWIGGGA